MYFVKTPKLIQNFFPSFKWRIPTKEKKIYLTFDDGPIPEVTPWVLEQLNQYNAKATFFCVGDNVRKHRDIYEQVVQEGHCVGNHTHNHLNGWNTSLNTYLENIEECAKHVDSDIFRPPYGKIKPSHFQALNDQYSVIMWDVLSGDFDPKISKEQCLQNVIKNSGNGSIIVFHDSLKAKTKLRFVLPRVLEHFHKLGFEFITVQEPKPIIKKKEVKEEMGVLV